MGEVGGRWQVWQGQQWQLGGRMIGGGTAPDSGLASQSRIPWRQRLVWQQGAACE